MAGKYFYWGFIEEGSFTGLPTSNVEPLSMAEIRERSQQYIGIKDSDGKEIYVGDIIDGSKFPDESCPSVVVFEDGAFRRKHLNWDESVTKPVLDKRELSCCARTNSGCCSKCHCFFHPTA